MIAQVKPLSELVWIRPRGNHDGNISSLLPKFVRVIPSSFNPVVMTDFIPSDEMAMAPWAWPLNVDVLTIDASDGGVVGECQVSPPSVVMVRPGLPWAMTVIPLVEEAMEV